MAIKPSGEPSWFYRRTMAFLIVGFCFCMVALALDRADTELNQAIVSGAFWLMGIVFLLYGGFATVQDVMAIWTMRTARPYGDPPPPPVDPAPTSPDVVVVQQSDKPGGE